MPFEDANSDDTLMRILQPDVPSILAFFIEKDIYEDLPATVILDYVIYEETETELLFIPPIPRKLSEYRFFDINKSLTK